MNLFQALLLPPPPRVRAVFLCLALSAACLFSCCFVLAAPARSSGTPHGASYVLSAGDIVSISVAGLPEFAQPSVTIPPDGVVTVPRFGTVRLGGRSVSDAQNALRAALIARARVRAPQVALAVTTFAPTVVTVSGDVPRPGAFPIKPGERLSALLAEVGLTDRLEEKRAALARGGRTITLDLQGATRNPGGATDIVLRSGDFLAVRALAPAKVTILGEVDKPGPYELHARPRADANELPLNPRLSDLLTKAGWHRAGTSSGATGTKTDAGEAIGGGAAMGAGAATSNFRATLQRGAEVRSLDLAAALDAVNSSANVSLSSGDVITVSAVQPITVFVGGLVARPGLYSVAPGTNVLQLLTQAGGPTRSPEEIVASVARGDQKLPLDLSAILLSSNSANNLALQNNDTLQLSALSTLEVLVSGQVARPGTVSLRPGATVFEALTQAGGLAVPVEDALVRVLRKNPDGTQTILSPNVREIMSLQNVSTNAVLQPGDVVNVAKTAQQTVYINGEVVTPNAYTLREGEGLTQLITRAGGVKDSALLSKISVTRGAQTLPVDAYDAVKKNQPLAFNLQDGDQVLVPRNPNNVLVIEAVAKPGPYPIPERGTLTLADVLAQAAPVVGTSTVFIGHRNADGTYSTDNKAIKLDDLRRGRVANPVLQPGDVVFVPSPKTKRSFLEALGLIAPLRFFFP